MPKLQKAASNQVDDVILRYKWPTSSEYCRTEKSVVMFVITKDYFTEIILIPLLFLWEDCNCEHEKMASSRIS